MNMGSSFGNSIIGGSKRSSFTSDADRMEGSFRFIEIPFSPLHNKAHSDVEDDLFISPRDYGSRQAYLRSYTFTRADAQAAAEPAPYKVKKSLLRLKAAAWAVVACQYRLPLRARVFKETLVMRTSQYLSNGVHYLRPSRMQCVMAGA